METAMGTKTVTTLSTAFKPGLGALVITLSALALAGCQSGGSGKVITEDPCGASKFKHLVGTSAKGLDMSQFAAGTRLLYPTTPMTRDYRIDRMNIHADKEGKIMRIDCS